MIFLFFALLNFFIISQLRQLLQYAESAAVIYTQGTIQEEALMQLIRGNESKEMF